MRNSNALWILFFLLLVVDFYCFRSVRFLVQKSSQATRTAFYIGYITLSLATIISLFLLPVLLRVEKYIHIRNIVLTLILAILFAKLLAALIFFIDDLRLMTQWVFYKIKPKPVNVGLQPTQEFTTSRSGFLTWLGVAMGGGTIATFIMGFGNKYNYQIKRHTISHALLPKAFKGFKAIQISDVHSGSFTNPAAVQKGIDKIMQQKPDVIFFTGDIVNDRATEMENYIDIFKQLQAPMGVYAILGNHDYGDYVNWESQEEKRNNLEKLKQIFPKLGWKLLLNEHILLERDNEKIAVLGIENWSAKSQFPKHGNLAKAYQGTQDISYKILLSHDPSHWEAEVLPKYNDIQLMLSGHTHGMQFGVEVPGFKWSPVQYFYKQWAGVYSKNEQLLYVNRGFGFLGYPGRVGILPEITLFQFA